MSGKREEREERIVNDGAGRGGDGATQATAGAEPREEMENVNEMK